MKKKTLAQVHCGSCSHLLKSKHFESNCAALGKLPSSKACSSHLPDAHAIANSPKAVERLSGLAHAMDLLSNTELQSLGTLMIREKITRKAGFTFRQKVYIRIHGSGNSNYLSNFVVGYVLDANPEFVRVTDVDGKVAIQVINDANSQTLFTVERFKEFRARMIAAKALTDPKLLPSKTGKEYNHILPVDVAVKDGLITNKKVSRAERDDLVALANRCGKGIMREKRSKHHVEDEPDNSLYGSNGTMAIIHS